jgi:cytochrome b pre-mRNA-processing protein 3
MLAGLFDGGSHKKAARSLYDAIVAQAREPAFYGADRVPDTLDGRFEMIVLHAFMVLHRLQDDAGEVRASSREIALDQKLSQALFDTMFLDMEFALREIGVSDLAVGKRVKDMAKGFYGRVAAYEAGLAAGDLGPALSRNLYGTVAASEPETTHPHAPLVGRYVAVAVADLAAQPLGGFRAGQVRFPPAPATA